MLGSLPSPGKAAFTVMRFTIYGLVALSRIDRALDEIAREGGRQELLLTLAKLAA